MPAAERVSISGGPDAGRTVSNPSYKDAATSRSTGGLDRREQPERSDRRRRFRAADGKRSVGAAVLAGDGSGVRPHRGPRRHRGPGRRGALPLPGPARLLRRRHRDRRRRDPRGQRRVAQRELPDPIAARTAVALDDRLRRPRAGRRGPPGRRGSTAAGPPHRDPLRQGRKGLGGALGRRAASGTSTRWPGTDARQDRAPRLEARPLRPSGGSIGARPTG